MQRELSQTREELQKGVLDMPAEAVEASTAMRRAIAEQIDAISELSKIVSRSTGETAPSRTAPPMPAATGPTVQPIPRPGTRTQAAGRGPSD